MTNRISIFGIPMASARNFAFHAPASRSNASDSSSNIAISLRSFPFSVMVGCASIMQGTGGSVHRRAF